jgi:benzoyl-CoA 2,3-dioxygenase component B
LRLSLPSSRFRRQIGPWAGQPVDPQGQLVSREEYERRLGDWIPDKGDRAFVHSLMQRVIEPGKMAAWIAPPERGINNLAVNYEYVRLNA